MAWNSTLTPHQRLPHHRGMDRRRFLLTSLAVFLAWRTLNFPRTFKNQGDCVSFVNTAR
jgi:hypothetical protein